MKLRLILLTLSLLSFLAASTGGYFYYAALKKAAFEEAERQSATRAEMIKKNLTSYLSEDIRPASTLAGMSELQMALTQTNDGTLAEANAILDHFRDTLDVDVCFLMDHQGSTIASTNRDAPDSFVGNNFSFRPYFKQAIQGMPATYLALGTISRKRGVYYAHPVFDAECKEPLGVSVIKRSIEEIENELVPTSGEIVLVTNPLGIVFISNRKEWLYKTLWEVSSEEISQMPDSFQFGGGPWHWTGLKAKMKKYAVDSSGNEYLMHQIEMDYYPGWKVVELQNLRFIAQSVFELLIRSTGPMVLSLCFLIGISVCILYRKASAELAQRKAAETALRESEERYRSIYHNAPAMLHSINTEGRLVRVSDHWLAVLGYRREEVIGRKLIRFLSEDSGRYVETVVIPEFLKTGFCSDIPYRFIKKNGGKMDVLVSLIGERDKDGNIIRSLAVSIDVTERKRAERALQCAKEALSRYSKQLERKVDERTIEIKSILKYTPDVVYIKDQEGRYTLVNSRFEALFDVKNAKVRGKTDYDLFPKEIADQFHGNDLRVLSEKRSYQVEEQVPQDDGIHTYLSVKFPIYGESGTTSVCGISTDITPVKKAQDQLRRFSASILASQEKERSAIARELHDELGQMLTALRMDSVWIEQRLQESDSIIAERAASMCSLIDQTIDEVRGMATRLRPSVLDSLGLVDALEWYTTDFERRTGIVCIFKHFNVPLVRDTLATATYRIAQEALTNVARHAAAGRVDVLLKEENNTLTLIVHDDGCGFDTQLLLGSDSLGLTGMRERAKLVGGQLEVRSHLEKGTRICFNVPIFEENHDGLEKKSAPSFL